MQHETSRRALIGGAGLAAVILAAPTLVAATPATYADTTAWDNALRDFRHAEATADRHWQAIEEPARQNPATRTADEHAAIHQESDRLGSAREDAEDRLFEVPAPHAAALALKLELLFAEGRDPIPGFQRLVLADAKRLAGVA